MRTELQGTTYPNYRLSPDRELARKFMAGMGIDEVPMQVPLTYLIFLRGERRGVDLFKDLEIPRQKALHGGQRYEWFAPVAWDDLLDVTVKIDSITEKQGKRGPIWFADISYEYRRVHDGALVVREVTRLVKQA
jgi:hypothetical protein